MTFAVFVTCYFFCEGYSFVDYFALVHWCCVLVVVFLLLICDLLFVGLYD